MNRYAIIGIGLVIVAVAVFFVLTNKNARNEPGTNDLERLSEFALTDYEGKVVHLADFTGKPLVVNTWAAWCPFCRKELPDFATLQKEFPSIVVIAIDRAEPLSSAKGYTDELGISDKMFFLLDSSDDFYKNIGGFSMPETIFVDSSGAIVFHKRGPMTLDEMRQAVAQYFK